MWLLEWTLDMFYVDVLYTPWRGEGVEAGASQLRASNLQPHDSASSRLSSHPVSPKHLSSPQQQGLQYSQQHVQSIMHSIKHTVQRLKSTPRQTLPHPQNNNMPPKKRQSTHRHTHARQTSAAEQRGGMRACTHARERRQLSTARSLAGFG